LVFKEFMGLPAHALLVHAAVVFVPLLALIAVGYGVLPRQRGRIGWAAAILAVVGPVTAFFAKESGEELEHVLTAKNYPPEILQQVQEHGEYGGQLFWWTLGLGVATGLLLFATGRHPRVSALPSWVGLLLTGVVVVLGLITAGYVYLTGDSGAQAVWKGVL
jgi:4-amino-4-deoxy-L-arabinose transferase-like glycosyltransferase